MRINLRDFTMEYEDRGSGTPVILIHGYPLSKSMWEGQLDALSDTARMIAIDLRGHGDSHSTRLSHTMRLMADDIYEFINKSIIEKPVVLCGLSMGGYICLEFIRRYPDLVRGIILAATRATADSIQAKANRKEAIVVARERGAEAIASLALPKMFAPATYVNRPDLVEQVRNIMATISAETIIADLKGMLDRVDSTPYLDQIKSPVLILHGGEDQIIPKSEIDLMQTKIKTVRVQIIPDAGHLLNIERPDQFNKALREFIQSI